MAGATSAPHTLRKPADLTTVLAGAPPAPARTDLNRMERPKKRLDGTSYKLYYVNYAIGFFRPAFSRPKPESGYLFPPSAYCPHDCECCPLPCKLSRYHLGPHTCGKRHALRFNTIYLLNAICPCAVFFFFRNVVVSLKLGARVRRFVFPFVSVRISSQNNLVRSKENCLYAHS